MGEPMIHFGGVATGGAETFPVLVIVGPTRGQQWSAWSRQALTAIRALTAGPLGILALWTYCWNRGR